MSRNRMFTRHRAGALPFTRFNVSGGEAAQTGADIEMLFDQSSLSELHALVKEAGFPEFPTELQRGERVKIAARYAGAPPASDDPKNYKGSLAFALYAMSSAVYQRAQIFARDGNEHQLGEAWHNGILQGQIAMWWRWRSDGHDASAVSRGMSTATLKQSTSTANSERATKRLERTRLARQFAAETNRKGGALVKHVRNRFVAEGYKRPADRTVRDYLRK